MKSSLSSLLVSVFILLTVLTGYGFWYAAISAKSAAAVELEKQIQTKAETISRIASARAALAEISGDEKEVREYFVPESGVVAFITDLEERGKVLGAAIQVLSVAASGGVAHPALVFSLSVSGTFDAVMRTVGAIEFAPYAISITSLSVEQEAKDVWGATLRFSVGSVSTSAEANPPRP